MDSMARRMFELVEPIGVIPYSADEPNEAMFALGFTDYWDTYFAGRAAPLVDIHRLGRCHVARLIGTLPTWTCG